MEPSVCQGGRSEFDVLMATKTRNAIEREGVDLLGYREIQSARNNAGLS